MDDGRKGRKHTGFQGLLQGELCFLNLFISLESNIKYNFEISGHRQVPLVEKLYPKLELNRVAPEYTVVTLPRQLTCTSFSNTKSVVVVVVTHSLAAFSVQKEHGASLTFQQITSLCHDLRH
jgi:hypothetical protein